ncbi:MAG: ATPase [Bacteroidales bacterium]|nr:ATPase [Bacteroidales bacterium]
MLLIADSGSTKTEWMLIDQGKLIKTIYTEGFNPYYYGVNEIVRILNAELIPQLDNLIPKQIFYYGSGCSTEQNCNIVSNALRSALATEKITVMHDLLAAAHSLLGESEGIACILGTGSNSCYFDGNKITMNVPSLGYLLADEGSGVYIGKLFITAYLYGEVPDSIVKDFKLHFQSEHHEILDALYRREKPGKYLSEFTRFVGKHIPHSFCQQLVAEAFDAFIRVQLSKYPDYKNLPVTFTGSVAFHFREILKERLKKAGVNAGIISHSPGEGLLKFYLKKA